MISIRGLSMRYVFQFYHLIPTLNALENVAVPAREHAHAGHP